MNTEGNPENPKVPELRFPEFKEEWEEKFLDDICYFRNGKAHEQFIDNNGNYIVINSKFISTEGKVIKKSKVSLEPLYTQEIVMVMSDVPNGRALAKCYIVDADDKYSLNQRICALKIQNGNSHFLYFILNRNEYYLSFDNGVGQTNLKKDEVLSCPLTLPSHNEQMKIAKFLTAVDERIQGLVKKKELLEQYKKGVMQKLFSQKIRFTQDDGTPFPDWKEKSLNKVFEWIKDGTHGTHNDDENGKYYLLSAKNIKPSGLLITADDRRISETEFAKITKNYSLQKGDLLLSIVGTIGRVTIFNGQNNIAFQRSVAFLRTDNSDPEFMFQLMQSWDFQKELDRRKVVSAQPGIYLGDIGKIEIFVPHLEEQKRIADFLSSIDGKINAVEDQLKAAKTFKKGLLQVMFV